MSRIAQAFFRLIDALVDTRDYTPPMFANNIGAYINSVMDCVEPTPQALSLASRVKAQAAALGAMEMRVADKELLHDELCASIAALKTEIARCPAHRDKIVST